MFRSKDLVLLARHLKRKVCLTLVVADDQSGTAPKASRLSLPHSPTIGGAKDWRSHDLRLGRLAVPVGPYSLTKTDPLRSPAESGLSMATKASEDGAQKF